MGIAYISFCVVLTLVFVLACVKQKLPKWWPIAVLVMPLTAPIFIFKSKKGPAMGLVGAFFGALLAVVAVEFYLYADYKENNKYSHLHPIVREMIVLNEAVKASTIEIYHASGKLSSLTLAQSRITDLSTTIDLIGKMRKLILKNQADVAGLLAYINNHGEYIRAQNLGWAFWISKFYQDIEMAKHHHSRLRYFAAFEDMLQYTYENFDNIMELQSSQHMANYDAYYMRYRGVADMHNRANKKRIAFQKDFMQEHPVVMPFLPGAHHLEPFKFWDKFSF